MKRFIRIILASSFLTLSAWALADMNRGFPLSTEIWDTLDIPVCWENLSHSTSIERGWVRSAVGDTWERHSDVNFTGWQECTANSNGIRIGVEDTGPHTKGLGTQLDGRAEGMVLNFTFDNWSTPCRDMVQFCSEVIAVHEFGHALGFAHEHYREDTPDSCTKHSEGTHGDMTIGEWDLDSVMNYCNPNWNGDGSLSATDIEMVQRFYSADTAPISGTKVCEFNDPVQGTTSGCTSWAIAGQGYTVVHDIRKDGEHLMYMTRTTQPMGWTNTCSIAQSGSSSYRVSGNCDNYRVYVR